MFVRAYKCFGPELLTGRFARSRRCKFDRQKFERELFGLRQISSTEKIFGLRRIRATEMLRANRLNYRVKITPCSHAHLAGRYRLMRVPHIKKSSRR